MNASSDAAEQVVRISIEGAEFAVKIAGKGAKELAAFLYAALKGSTRTKGKTRLAGLLRSGKELKVFSLNEGDLKRFAQEAKKYGVLYAALKGMKRSEDGMVDIMVKTEDASKINRIFDRFSIAAVDTAEVRHEVLRAAEQKAAQLRDTPEPSAEAVLQQEQAAPNAEKPHTENKTNFFAQRGNPTVNPTQAREASSNQSATSSGNSSKYKREGTEFEDTRSKPSVRKQLEEIKAERHDTPKPARDNRQTSPQHKNPQNKRKNKKGR